MSDMFSPPVSFKAGLQKYRGRLIGWCPSTIIKRTTDVTGHKGPSFFLFFCLFCFGLMSLKNCGALQHAFLLIPVWLFPVFLLTVELFWVFFHEAHYNWKSNGGCNQKAMYIGVQLEWFRMFVFLAFFFPPSTLFSWSIWGCSYSCIHILWGWTHTQ